MKNKKLTVEFQRSTIDEQSFTDFVAQGVMDNNSCNFNAFFNGLWLCLGVLIVMLGN